MKKIRIIIVLFILAFSFSVKADVYFGINCASKEIGSEGITCEGSITHNKVSIEDITFDYSTNLDIEFEALPGFTLAKNNNQVTVHADNALYSRFMDSQKVIQFTLKSNSKLSNTEELTFSNIHLNKDESLIVENVRETFDIVTEKILDSNCTLDSITVDKVSVSNFDANKFEYHDIVVSKDIVFVDAKRTSDKSAATDLGDVWVKPGETIAHKITVTAEDNTKCIYTLYITNQRVEVVEKEPEKHDNSIFDNTEIAIADNVSKDNTLKTLELWNEQKKINFTFNPSNDVYKISLDDSSINSITIKASLNDNKASFVSEYGPRKVLISPGDNKILIKVKAENNDLKVYTISVIQPIIEKSDDNTLKSLKINDKVIDLIDGIDEYTIYLSNDVLKTNVECELNDAKAKVDYQDIDLTADENNLLITVTSESGKKREYKISILHQKNISLEDISVVGYDLNFFLNQTDYTLKINDDTSSLKFIVNPSNIKYEILNNNNLSDGSIITIKVHIDDDIKEYNINIIKEKKEFNIIIYSIIGVIIISVIILLMLKKRKKKNKGNMDIEII